MNFALVPYLFFLFLSVAVCWFIAFYAWRRRQVTAAAALTAVMFAAGYWAFVYSLELIATTLPAKLFFFNLKQLGASILGPAVLFFTLQVTQQRLKHALPLLIVLLIEPVTTQLVFWTNAWHRFAGSPRLVTDVFPFSVLYFDFGPWYWVSIFVGYILLTFSILILVMRLPGANEVYRGQLNLLMLGLLLPWLVGSLGLFGLFNWHLLDATTFVFWLSGLLVGLGLFRYQLLQLSPVAYSAVFSSIRDGIIVMNENGRIIEINPAALDMLGLRERELLGQQISTFLPIPSTAFPQDEQKSAAAAFSQEFFYDQGGQNRFLQISGAKIVNNIYSVSGHVLILYDVTERVLAQKAQQYSENRYRTIFETNSSAIIIIEADMTISLANEQFAKLSGYSRQEIEGKLNWTQFVHEDDLPWMQAYHKGRRQNDKNIPSSYEFRFITRQNEVKNVYNSVAMVPESSISIASLLDITDRKVTEQLLQQKATDLETAVRAEQKRSAIILQSINDAIALSDLTFKVIYVNPAFARLTGFSNEEAVGKPANFVLNGRLPQPIWKQLQNAIIDQTIWEGEIQMRRKDGSIYDAAILIAPVYDGNKQLIGYVSSHRDITQAKRLEDSRRRFVTSISHELRTPVTNLKLYSDLLHRHFDSARREHYFEVLNEQIDRLEKMIQNTLDIAKLEEKQKSLQRERIHWEALIDSLQVRLQPQAAEKQITLTFDSSLLELPGILGDAQRLTQAIYELIHNALIFTQPGGSVKVAGDKETVDQVEWLKIDVRDNGPGIDTKEQPQVFDRFFRSKRLADGNIPGTGLGLSTVKLIAEAHNGRITLKSTPGQGSTFTLWLPLN